MNAPSFAPEPPGYVVETPACDDKGRRVGTMSHWVLTKERAIEEAAKVKERTWREVPFDELPAAARAAMLKVRRSGEQG
ncbi:MAG: hypothetical protein JWM74_4916 [Myxococcaceae bacterium]|nr:hypothetical protein [Myxococcaceae bacterium]